MILVQLEHRADREVTDQVQNSGLLSTLGISGLDIANLLSHFVNGQSGVALYRCIIIIRVFFCQQLWFLKYLHPSSQITHFDHGISSAQFVEALL